MEFADLSGCISYSLLTRSVKYGKKLEGTQGDSVERECVLRQSGDQNVTYCPTLYNLLIGVDGITAEVIVACGCSRN